jgi:hypothetical protein
LTSYRKLDFTGRVAQGIACLPSKCKALSSTHSTAQKNKEKEKNILRKRDINNKTQAGTIA